MKLYELYERNRSIGLYFSWETAHKALEQAYYSTGYSKLADYSIKERTAR